MAGNEGLLSQSYSPQALYFRARIDSSGPEAHVHSLAQRVLTFLHALFLFFSITNNHVYPDTRKSPIENIV
ncbi:MAG: hypothetical protein JWR14_1752 [Caballeronia sp.]|jgi:hypothetical protein|nr:hypothetical protein [Caballeronia sp.]